MAKNSARVVRFGLSVPQDSTIKILLVIIHSFFSQIDGLLPKSFFAGSETFFDKSKARSRRFQNSPFGLKQLESLFFHFAKIYEKNVSMSAQKDFCLGNILLIIGTYKLLS
jgi:hypothetical protein